MQPFNPFRLSLKPAWLARSIEKVLSLNSLANHYDNRPAPDAADPCEQVDGFLQHTLSALQIDFQLDNPEALSAIPTSGPVLIIANHPLGGPEGVAMSSMLREIRPDLKVLTNELLSRIPEFGDLFIGVDVLSKEATRKNIQGMRKVMDHMKSGGALLVYPAGKVSALNLRNRRIEDRTWSDIVGKLAKKFQASCVPFYVHGRNSSLFYLAGLLHPLLRTALLPRELTNKTGQTIKITAGSPINWQDMKGLSDSDSITNYLRTATELLSHANNRQATTQSLPPLAEPQRIDGYIQQLESELEQLAEFRLLQYRSFDVYCAPYARLGKMMGEIAIARERTFRAAGEGTGFAADSDQFDPHYLHLFIWDREQQGLVGGYRLGLTDQIIDKQGVKGLYSRSLYKFEEHYIQRIGKALEMGRSFVTPEYQRHPRALDLLWQGIGCWVAQNPDYHTLFGCVSISREHSSRAREFLKDSLMQNFRAEQTFLNDVRPVAPLKVRNRVWNRDVLQSLNNLTLINKLLGQCDPGKSIPVLLRQYLALNGRFIGFSINHSFNQSLDGLIMVDLRKTPNKYLQRYLGKAGSETFIKHWNIDHAAA